MSPFTRLKALFLAAGLAALVPSLDASSPNLVLDGGFESIPRGAYSTGPLGAWSLVVVSDNAGVYVPGEFPGANVTEGTKALDIAEGGFSTGNSISQPIPTNAGHSYSLTFDWGSEYDWGTYSRVQIGSLNELLIDQPLDGSGTAGTWIQHSASFAFVATGSDVLTFTDLTNDANAPGPHSTKAGLTLDNIVIAETDAPVMPCEHTFASGSGSSLIRYCVSSGATIVQLEGPAGAEHLRVDEVIEGFVVCSGTIVQDWDLSATGSGFGPATVSSGPTSSGITLQRSSPRFQLDQKFALDKNEKDVTITMTLKNISGAMIPDVRLTRAYDPDVNGNPAADLEVKSARAVWAGDVNAVTLTGTSWTFAADTAIDNDSSPACSAGSGVPPAITADARLASVTYRLGNLGPGAKKTVKFVYRLQ